MKKNDDLVPTPNWLDKKHFVTPAIVKPEKLNNAIKRLLQPLTGWPTEM